MNDEDSFRGDTRPRRQDCFHNLRFVVLITAGFALGMMQFFRMTIAVAMVSMVNHTALFIHTHANMTEDDFAQLTEYAHNEVGEFDWNNEIQELVISSYMITYMIFQFPAAKLIATYGLRWGICVTIALCALFNALTPVFAHWGWHWALALRLAHGAVASGLTGSMVSLTERWSPKGEAPSGYVLYQFTGNILSITTPFIGGLLASFQWKWAFYVPGLVAVLFCIFWIVLVSDRPEESSVISQKELDFLRGKGEKDSLDQHGSGEKSTEKAGKTEIAFYRVFGLKEFYCFLFIWCMYWASSSCFTVLFPAYIHRVFQVPVDQVGGITTAAQLGALLSMLWPNRVVDLLINRFKFSLTSSRKIATAISVLMANSTLASMALFHNNIIVAANINRVFHVALDTISTATIMSQFGELGLSGLVFSMLNSLSCLSGTVFCVLVGKFQDYTGDTLECWSWVFMAAIIMNFLYLLVNTLFCHSRPVSIDKSVKSKCDQAMES